jgi:hypothetical protein
VFTSAHASTDECGSVVIARFRYEVRLCECDAVRVGRYVPCWLNLCSALIMTTVRSGDVSANRLPDYMAS